MIMDILLILSMVIGGSLIGIGVSSLFYIRRMIYVGNIKSIIFGMIITGIIIVGISINLV